MRPERGVALVTGAGRGIGAAIAAALDEAGFRVARASLEPEEPQSAFAGEGRYYSFDLARIDGHAALLERVGADLGPIACLVNNAGVTSLVRGDMLDLTPESFDRCLSVNLRGTFFLTQAVARRMLARPAAERRDASIITISSANAEIVGENRADYCISKAGLAMMNKLFASRLGAAGIAAYEIRPGIIETDMTAPAHARYDALVAEGGVPMQRWGQPADIAKTVATLASCGLPYATGMHFDIGGGLHLHRL